MKMFLCRTFSCIYITKIKPICQKILKYLKRSSVQHRRKWSGEWSQLCTARLVSAGHPELSTPGTPHSSLLIGYWNSEAIPNMAIGKNARIYWLDRESRSNFHRKRVQQPLLLVAMAKSQPFPLTITVSERESPQTATFGAEMGPLWPPQGPLSEHLAKIQYTMWSVMYWVQLFEFYMDMSMYRVIDCWFYITWLATEKWAARQNLSLRMEISLQLSVGESAWTCPYLLTNPTSTPTPWNPQSYRIPVVNFNIFYRGLF